MNLPDDMLAIANRETYEEAWRIADFPTVLERATAHGLACIGGNFQFRGPIGIAEIYWLNADAEDRKSGETWSDYLTRANSQVLASFTELVKTTDFHAEARRWEHIRKALAAGAISDPTEHLWFVAYFESEHARA